MTALQFNRKTMPLRRSPKRGAIGYYPVRKFCFFSILAAVAMVAFALYVDQGLVRNLDESQSMLIRKPAEYPSGLSDTPKKDENKHDEFINPDEHSNDSRSPASKETRDHNGLSSSTEEQSADQDVKETPNYPNNVPIDEMDTIPVQPNGDQPNMSEKNRRSRLFLHVGPQKTGSSTLQSALDIISDLTYKLDHDNLVYRHITPEEGDFDCDLEPWGGFVNCVVSDKLKNLMAETRRAGMDLLLTDENLGDRFVNPLRAAINDEDWDVTVIVMYRRIHLWLVSWYNQINKTTNLNSDGKILVDANGTPYREEHKHWPSDGGVYVPEFTAWYKDYIKHWQPSELVGKHRSIEYFDLYKDAFTKVVVYNMHSSKGDIVTDFFCDVIQTSNACERLRKNEVELSEVNASVNLDHDILATFFYDHDFVKNDMTRQDVVAAITNFVVASKKENPRKCDAAVSNQIRDWLVESEKQILGDTWTDKSEQELKGDFEEFLEKGKICDLDRDLVLQDEEWIAFFRSLGKSGDEEQPVSTPSSFAGVSDVKGT